ncbi:hypothetical protein [uncultured Clostridium sp.]|uniref:hypothetical protein n=1 Tax=uncultured Clostridium sp. TaxID=59620 RepID=UPI00263A9B1D|nr:hypothetical protein [uncultured Clostridium sp.]
MAIGVITEQGDLGLGFNPISENEENQIKDNLKSFDSTEKSWKQDLNPNKSEN